MSEEEKVSGQAAEAGTDDTKLVSGQAGEPGTDETGKGTGIKLYTPEELEALHPVEIDLERVDPVSRPIVEKTIKEYKTLQGTYTKTSQELAELRKEKPPEPTKHFDDPQKNEVFEQYLKEPLKVVSNINTEIMRLSGIRPVINGEDNPEYETAQKNIAYWNGIKDEFTFKKDEIITRKKDVEILDAKINIELGDKAGEIREYANNLGFSDADLRKPQLRKSVVEMYKVANAGKTADGKLKKPTPPNLASPAGSTGGGTGQKPLTEVNDINEYAVRRGFGKDKDRQYI